VIATALVAVVALVAQLITPPPAEAALQEIARAAESTPAIVPPSGEYAHVVETTMRMGVVPADAFADGSQDLVYFLETTYERWVSDDEVRLRTTVGEPVFLSPADESRYYSGGFDSADTVGQTTLETLTGVSTILDEGPWPTDPSELEATLRALAPTGTGRPADIEVLDLAVDLIREAETPPELRAAAVTVISGLDPRLVERMEDGGGAFSFSWQEPLPSQLIVTIDGSGFLVREQLIRTAGDPSLGLPANTVIEDTRYGPWEIVDESDVP
jgi:hypothetical protein